MKTVLCLILIHLFALSIARAEEPSAADDCKVLLPQIENDERDLEAKYQSLTQGLGDLQENYLMSFNQMTQALFQLVQAREEETQKISQSRDQLRVSLQRFNEQRTSESSKSLQESYADLTVRLYTSLNESQKILDAMKTQLSQVEASRNQFSGSKQEIESIDQQKLALEAKLVSLKIKCQPEKRY